MSRLPSIAPFRGLRFGPKAGDLSQVVAPPYDVIGSQEEDELFQKSPHNIIRLILPRGRDYQKAAGLLQQWIAEGVLIRDPEPALTLYEQQFDIPGGERLTRRGFIGLRRLEPLGGEVLPHEQTLAGPKADRLQLLRACRANLSPLFAIYNDPQGNVRVALDPHFRGPPDGDFTDRLGIRHRLWKVTVGQTIDQVSTFLEGKKLFLADGHHRYETALAYRDETREPAARYVLMFFAEGSDPGLLILPTHRIVSKITIPARDLLAAQPAFTIKAFATQPELLKALKAFEKEGHAFGVLLPDSTESLLVSWRPEVLSSPLSAIGTAVAHEVLLKAVPLDCIEFVKEPEKVFEALRRPDTTLGLLMNPPRMAELQEAVAAGHLMPPKTTFFYPKLLSGLVLNPLFEI